MCLAFLVVGTSTAQASSPCTNSTGTSYSIRVCITAPQDGAVLTSDATVTATTALVSGTSPGVQRVVFSLDGAYLLTDYSPPYTFTLPAAKFVDGARVLSVSALMRDGTTTTPSASINLTFATGTKSPPVNPNTFSPKVANPPTGSPVIVGAVGDGAGGDQDAADVTNLVSGWNPSMFLYLGDVYEKGSIAEFANWFGPSGSSSLFYGKLKPITDPTIGNHEYTGSQAPGYFDYWDNVPHYYSFNAGAWHFISLDANSAFNQLKTTSAQYKWLSQDLAANTKPCTLVYYHQPLFNIGQEGSTTGLSAMWSLFASRGVDLVVNGHDHTYQRWQPLNGSGNPSATGVTELVAGMGGHAHGKWATTDSRVVKSDNTHYGALRLALNGAGADFQFVAVGGQVIDSGSVPCDPAASDTTPPTAPTNLAGSSTYKTSVQLSWTSATDAVGVTGNQVYRDGTLLTTIGVQTTYADTSVTAGSSHTYQVRAVDAAGNTSQPSNSVSVTTPTTAVLFHDGFESGDLSAWTTSSGLLVQPTTVYAGAFAAEAAPSAAPAPYAMKQFPAPESEIYYALRFNVRSQPSGNINLLRVRAANPPSNSSLATVFITSSNKLGVRNDVGGASTNSTTVATRGQWHLLQAHVLVDGGSSRTDVWLDGTPVPSLSINQNFGIYTGMGQTELSAKPSGTSTYDVVFDEVSYDREMIPDPAGTPPSAPGTPAATATGATTATISWARSSDDVGVVRYDVSRDGAVVGSVLQPASGDPSFADSGLSPSTTYAYVVTAFDAAGNHTDSPSGSVTTTAAADTTPPSKPVVSAAPASTSVTLTWPRATDDVAVTRYDITRGTTAVGSVSQPASGNVSFTDNGVTPGTAYAYVVTAFDAAGNSTPSDTVPVTTVAGGPVTTTLTTVADAKVDASTPSSNFAKVALRVDASPDVRSYVKFDASGITGTVQSATLRIWATSAQTVGFDAYGVADSTWTETGLTYANQPSSSIGAKLGASGAVAAGTWKTIDVTALVHGAGVYSLVLETTSGTALALASREDAAHPPQLVVTTT
jgi:fibronectin type 3 domain-containing protein